jgi:hypothetical protein
MRVPALVRTAALAAAIVAGAIMGELYVGATERHDEVTCRPAGAAVQLQGLREASGLALSRRTPGILWSFNDSGDPVVYALDRSGQVKGTVRIAGAEVKNWEAVTTARCANGSCLYIADIGDNKETRPTITIYRVPEPRPSDTTTSAAERFVATYPDGPHDAEALFSGRNGALYIVTKDKPALVFQFPESLRAGTPMRLERVTVLPMEGVTDADASPSGEWIGVRSKEEIVFFREEEFTLGEHGTPISVRALNEPQGEGIAIGDDGMVYLASEGKHNQPGTFRTMKCAFPG